MRLIAIISICLLLIGCAGQKINLGKNDSSSHNLVLAKTSASERVVIADISTGKVCAEPPPETQLSTELTTSLSALAKKAAAAQEANVQIEFLNAYSRGVQQLYKRSHSNAMFRDAAYYLCQAHANGDMGDLRAKHALYDLRSMLDSESISSEKLESLSASFGSLLKQTSTSHLALIESQASQEFLSSMSTARNIINSIKDEADESQKSLKLKNQKDALKDIESSLSSYVKESNDRAYLSAFSQIAMRAFESLDQEVKVFYGVERAKNEGKLEGIKETKEEISSQLKQLANKLDDPIDKKLSAVGDEIKKNSTEIKEIKEAISTSPPKAATSGN